MFCADDSGAGEPSIWTWVAVTAQEAETACTDAPVDGIKHERWLALKLLARQRNAGTAPTAGHRITIIERWLWNSTLAVSGECERAQLRGERGAWCDCLIWSTSWFEVASRRPYCPHPLNQHEVGLLPGFLTLKRLFRNSP
jgi:hypothetical protein